MSTLAAAILEDQKVPNIVTYNAGPMGGVQQVHRPWAFAAWGPNQEYVVYTLYMYYIGLLFSARGDQETGSLLR